MLVKRFRHHLQHSWVLAGAHLPALRRTTLVDIVVAVAGTRHSNLSVPQPAEAPEWSHEASSALQLRSALHRTLRDGAGAIGAHRLAFQLWRQYVQDPGSRLRVTDIEVTATIAFDALCQLVDESVRIFTLFEDDYDRTALVRALRNAGEVLSSESASVAADKADDVGLLNPAGPTTPIGPDNVLLRRKRNPLLAAIRLGSVQATLSPAAQLTFDCGNRHPRYPIRENADRTWQRLPEHCPALPELDPARISQVLWPGTVWARAGDTTTLASAAQAMALYKIGDTRPWTIIALDLGLPKGMATSVTQYWRQVGRDGHWPEALGALTNLKEQLRTTNPRSTTSSAASLPTTLGGWYWP